jgi:hypothetical protein
VGAFVSRMSSPRAKTESASTEFSTSWSVIYFTNPKRIANGGSRNPMVITAVTA